MALPTRTQNRRRVLRFLRAACPPREPGALRVERPQPEAPPLARQPRARLAGGAPTPPSPTRSLKSRAACAVARARGDPRALSQRRGKGAVTTTPQATGPGCSGSRGRPAMGDAGMREAPPPLGPGSPLGPPLCVPAGPGVVGGRRGGDVTPWVTGSYTGARAVCFQTGPATSVPEAAWPEREG